MFAVLRPEKGQDRLMNYLLKEHAAAQPSRLVVIFTKYLNEFEKLFT